MEIILFLLNRFFDVLWLPLSRTPHYFDIIVVSTISALIFLVIFKRMSNQEKIRLYKNRMIAHILEIRLYKDQPVLTIKSILNILWCNIIYIRYALLPLIVIFIPLLVISIQINNRYGYTPLEINKPFIMRVVLAGSLLSFPANILDKIRCDVSSGIMLETPPMIIEPEASIFWRARVITSKEDEQFCKITIDGTDGSVEKKIFTSSAKQRFSPERTKWHPRSFLLNNAEDFISEQSPFEAVMINYERARFPFLFWNADPVILYFVLTMIMAFLFKPIIKVTI